MIAIDLRVLRDKLSNQAKVTAGMEEYMATMNSTVGKSEAIDRFFQDTYGHTTRNIEQLRKDMIAQVSKLLNEFDTYRLAANKKQEEAETSVSDNIKSILDSISTLQDRFNKADETAAVSENFSARLKAMEDEHSDYEAATNEKIQALVNRISNLETSEAGQIEENAAMVDSISSQLEAPVCALSTVAATPSATKSTLSEADLLADVCLRLSVLEKKESEYIYI